MKSRFWISVAVTFVLFQAFGYFVHAFLLAPDYAQIANLFRSQEDQMKHLPYLMLGNFIASLAFVWVYLRGREEKPFLAQGVRYGLAVAALMSVAKFLTYFYVQPMPPALVMKQIGWEGIGVVVMGIAVALINR